MEKTIDLHGITLDEARHELEIELKLISNNIWRIVVIHGYKNGTTIRDMIRKNFRHKRVKKVNVDLNPGVSILELYH